MSRKLKNKVANRSKKAHARPSAKKRPHSKSEKHAAYSDRKLLAWMMNARSGRPVSGNSVDNAIGTLSTMRLKTRQDALNLQAGYLALYERLSRWTAKSDRVDLSRFSYLSDEGKPHVMLLGRIADVRYDDDWDDNSQIKSVCLMAPHAIDTVTEERGHIDSHLWLSMKKLAPNAEFGNLSAHIGDMVVLVGELTAYESEVKGEDQMRLGVSTWCPMYICFDAIVCGAPTVLKQRNLLSCKVFDIDAGNDGCEVHRARKSRLKPMIATLKESEAYRTGVKSVTTPPIDEIRAQAVVSEDIAFL